MVSSTSFVLTAARAERLCVACACWACCAGVILRPRFTAPITSATDVMRCPCERRLRIVERIWSVIPGSTLSTGAGAVLRFTSPAPSVVRYGETLA